MKTFGTILLLLFTTGVFSQPEFSFDTSVLRINNVSRISEIKSKINSKGNSFIADSVTWQLNNKFVPVRYASKNFSSTFFYDDYNNLKAVIDSVFSGSTGVEVSTLRWDYFYADNKLTEVKYFNRDGSVIDHFKIYYNRSGVKKELIYLVRKGYRANDLRFIYDKKMRLSRVATPKASMSLRYSKNDELEKVFSSGDLTQIPSDIKYYPRYKTSYDNQLKEKVKTAYNSDLTPAEKVVVKYDPAMRPFSEEKQVISYKFIFNSTGNQAIKTNVPVSTETVYNNTCKYDLSGNLVFFQKLDSRTMILEKWEKSYYPNGLIKSIKYYNINNEVSEILTYNYF